MKSSRITFNRFFSVFVMLLVLLSTVSCKFFSSFKDDDDTTPSITIDSLAVAKSTLNMKVGSMDYIAISVKPQKEQKNIKLDWSYDKSIIECDTTSNWGVTIKALKEGQTNLKCSYGGYDATCLITVSGYEQGYEAVVEPYIYSNTSILQTAPGVTEKVFVSLYGGDARDIDGYTWTIENPSVANIQPTGQYCLITAKDSGYARIKITHNRAAYPYYMGIYVFADATKVTYITTQNNILTMNQEDSAQTINVNLVNGNDNSSDSSFRWEILNNDENTVPVRVDYNGNKAVVTPLRSGSCTVRVTHPDASYPLDILCRVISIVKNVYIVPDNTVVSMNGDEQKTITCTMENIKDGEYGIDEYEFSLDDNNVAEIVNSVANQVTVQGKANGSCKLIISHPKSAYTREVLLIVTGQLTDAIDASCYITTTQNYIRTKVGAETIPVSISLRGGNDGDESGFIWNVKSTPKDGTSDVIRLETTNGIAAHSRAASYTYSYGKAYITPNSEGTAVISISHPKIVYPTEILVKVLSEDSVLEEPLFFAGEGIVKIINGESTEYRLELRGKNKRTDDDENIHWESGDSRVVISANANVAQITAPSQGSGNTISYVTVSHPKCDVDKRILVLTADTLEELENIKALYSGKLYYNIEVDDTALLTADSVGFPDTEVIDDNDENIIHYLPYDFSQATWTVRNPAVATVEKSSYNSLQATVKGLKAGTTTVTVTEAGISCDFTITVYPKGTVQTEPEIYFTTTQNVVNLKGEGKSTSVYVTGVNLPASEYSNITWSSDNTNIVSVLPNGQNATVMAMGEGTAVISVTHPDSQNTLKIYVRVGSEYVIPEAEPIVYISSTDVMTMLKDSQTQKLQAVLVNYSETNTSGFTFTIDNEDVAKISAQTSEGIAYIKPVNSGQAMVTISHTATNITKQVLILVGNSEEELAGLTYLTTSQNVIAVGEGNTRNISVSVKNSEDIILDGYSWTSSNPAVIDITASGASAVLTGNSIGTAIITVTNINCKYPLTIIAQCVDPIAAAANPYIQLTSSVLTLTVSSTYTNITADLVGGSESDYADFIWTSNDSSICAVYGQNEVGKIRALKEGTTYVTVSHPKSAFTAQILVVCDKKIESECYISVPSSIINMKPTDSSQSITASLINGSNTDKYNFSWSLDVYDIIDFQYSANVCTITPKQSGSCTITLSHPKAAYDQQIIVNVQEYSTFSFPNTNITITQGNVSFITMHVPNTNVATHVEYSVKDASKCSVSGTKAVAQIQGIAAGTTTVTAKLIASSTGVVQAESEMMVYVKEKETNAIYITSNSTITTVNKGKSQTLSASLVGNGVTASDNNNLKWSTSDSDIIQVTGINSSGIVTGSQIYITALKPGEALITCSHDKAQSNLQFYVVVPGTGKKTINLNKSYITIAKGSSGTQLKATIENAESSDDYHKIIWTCEGANNQEIARIMGSGQNVTIYPLKAGQAKVRAQLPDSDSYAECDVLVKEGNSLSFETTTRKLHPGQVKTVKYKVTPPDAVLTFVMTQDDDYFDFTDNQDRDSEGNGSIDIIANDRNKIGSGTLSCVTDGGAKSNISIRVTWDYNFTVKGAKDCNVPVGQDLRIDYTVTPKEARVSVESNGIDNGYFKATVYEDSSDEETGTSIGHIIITSLKETAQNVVVKLNAYNPLDGNAVVGTKQINLTFKYDKVHTNISLINKDGNFSHYDSNSGTLCVADGETVTMCFNVEELDANASIRAEGSGVSITYKSDGSDQKKKYYTIKICDDVIVYDYKIDSLLVPYYNNSAVNWQDDFGWRCWYNTTTWAGTTYRYDYFGLARKSTYFNACPNYTTTNGYASYASEKTWYYWRDDDSSTWNTNCYWTLKKDDSWSGRILSEAEFKNYAWLYCPGTPKYRSKNDIWVAYQDFQNGTYTHGGYGTGDLVNVSEHVMSNHVSYSLVPTNDKTMMDYKKVGTITVFTWHNGNEEPITINVILETYNCMKNQN